MQTERPQFQHRPCCYEATVRTTVPPCRPILYHIIIIIIIECYWIISAQLKLITVLWLVLVLVLWLFYPHFLCIESCSYDCLPLGYSGIKLSREFQAAFPSFQFFSGRYPKNKTLSAWATWSLPGWTYQEHLLMVDFPISTPTGFCQCQRTTALFWAPQTS